MIKLIRYFWKDANWHPEETVNVKSVADALRYVANEVDDGNKITDMNSTCGFWDKTIKVWYGRKLNCDETLRTKTNTKQTQTPSKN